MTKSQIMDWLVDNLHKLEVNVDMSYCEKQQCPSLSFRSLVIHDYRPWSIKGQSRERLRAEIEKAMLNKIARPTYEKQY